MPYMLLLSETAVTGYGVVTVELHDDLRYCLKYGALVEYRDGRRMLRGRTSAYEFRSVEQLRYDFERDVLAAGGQPG